MGGCQSGRKVYSKSDFPLVWQDLLILKIYWQVKLAKRLCQCPPLTPSMMWCYDLVVIVGTSTNSVSRRVNCATELWTTICTCEKASSSIDGGHTVASFLFQIEFQKLIKCFECLWVSVNVHECLWISVNICECLRGPSTCNFWIFYTSWPLCYAVLGLNWP